MNREEVARGRAKSLLESFSRGRAVQLDMLHNMLIVCLGAYVIAGSRGYPSGEAHGPFTYDYWLQVAGSQNTLYARDLVYDLIFPAAPKGLREAVRELEQNERLTAEVGPLVAELFSQRPGREELRELAEQLITGYYPLVIPAPIDTPLPVNRLCMEILAPKNGAFYDGTSGLGSTCMEAGRYAAGHGGGLNIFAQEKLDVLCAVSTVRAYLNGLEDFTVRGGDVLTAPAYTVGNTVASFDYSVMFPPLGLPWGEAERELAWDKYRRFSGGPVPRSNAEWLFVQHQLASLKEKGRGIIAVSTGSLFNDSARWIRRRLLETNCIDCVITLPSHILPYTATPLSLLVLDRGRDPDRTDVLMVQTEGMFRNVSAARVASQLDEELIQEITALLKEKTDTLQPCREHGGNRGERQRPAAQQVCGQPLGGDGTGNAECGFCTHAGLAQPGGHGGKNLPGGERFPAFQRGGGLLPDHQLRRRSGRRAVYRRPEGVLGRRPGRAVPGAAGRCAGVLQGRADQDLPCAGRHGKRPALAEFHRDPAETVGLFPGIPALLPEQPRRAGLSEKQADRDVYHHAQKF
ncbi:MAG: class I SAM-dependent DNA methyltransferase [Neglectibacter sp.]